MQWLFSFSLRLKYMWYILLFLEKTLYFMYAHVQSVGMGNFFVGGRRRLHCREFPYFFRVTSKLLFLSGTIVAINLRG